MIRVLGRRLVDFLNGIDTLHEVLMKFSYDKMRPPSFYVEAETPTGLILIYRFSFAVKSTYSINHINHINLIWFYLQEQDEKVICDFFLAN